MFHLSDRELYLLGEATRNQTAALVGWMVLGNMLGDVAQHGIDRRKDELPDMKVCRWLGSLNKLTGFRGQVRLANTQDVVPNNKRNVRVS